MTDVTLRSENGSTPLTTAQLDQNFSVLRTLERDRFTAEYYGAIAGGSSANSGFQAAANAVEMARLTGGAYALTTSISGDTRWIIEKGSSITGRTVVGNNSYPDMSNLGGRVVHFWDSPTRGGVLFGDPDPWPERVRNPSLSLAELAGVSPNGQTGILGATRTSDSSGFNMAGIAVYGLMNNDSSGTIKPGWGAYFETRRQDGAGAVLGVEIDMVNFGTTADLNPYTTRSNSSQDTMNIAFACGGGGIADTVNGSAAAAIYDNGQKFRRGFVFMNGALDTAYYEAIAMASPHRLAWYDSAGRISYIDANTVTATQKSDTLTTANRSYFYKKKADGVTATASTDLVWRADAYGYTGSADYAGAYIQMLQRSNFSGGQARFSVDLSANATDGTAMQVSLNGLADRSFAPNPDNAISLGSGSFRFTQLFLSSYIEVAEISAPAAPAADKARIYAVDNGSGKTQLAVVFSSGSAQIIATQP